MASPAINNEFYDDLGDRWFEGDDHAVALLRAESRIKVEYVKQALARQGIVPGGRVLDVACGAGLVSFPLAEAGYRVKGVDLAEGAIETARRRRPPGVDVSFAVADAYATGEPDGAYDAVLLLDMLEHVERPGDVLREAARVVRPGGAVVFHTFNRNPLGGFLGIYGMKIVARDTPAHVHVYDLFIKPEELRRLAEAVGLEVREMRGTRPVFDRALWWSVLHRRVHPDFRFTYTRSLAVGYSGLAVRR
ncbi:MAG TPA: bifunctional 2-polyprenyl-6-hydroxyphenol methylase/3-demethylubiquinol 3-O-methyltransferase UbiG [Rubricoccaceae bacterium]|nr:bifunctional 2-polyprenyl-6-hydroxyphenol methylase/3-demethylubiquinol 3-O-methyltransferase UbiG [Rubricoccaceae bacterium]